MADKIESTLTNLERGASALCELHDKCQADIARIEGDVRLSDAGKREAIAKIQAEIHKVFEARDALKAQADEIDAQLQDGARRITRAAWPEPRMPEELAEVNGLIPIYERDVASMSDDAIVQEFTDLLKDGRKWAAWAWYDAASRKLAGEGAAALDNAALAAWPADHVARDRIKDHRRILYERVRRPLYNLLTPQERRDLADRLGVKAEYIP
jgi:hypothetical protein